MATVSLTCTGNAPVQYQMPAFGDVTVTIISGAAEIWVTTDGTAPNPPSSTARTDGSNQRNLAGVVGAQLVCKPPRSPGFMTAPLVRIASSGTPVVELEY